MANGHGGKRAGAGRKPGVPKAPKPATLRLIQREKVKAILAADRDPVSILISLATDPTNDAALRLQAAAAAAPFCHPRLSAVAVQQTTAPAGEDCGAMLERLNARFAKLAPQPVALTIEATAESGDAS